jgi:Domain of unknown function (DUF4375)
LSKCQSEVCNGGFDQFFYNGTGVLAPEAAETSLVMAGLLLVAVPAASAQKPKPMPTQPQPAAMAQPPAQQQVVVVEPIRVFDPFFTYPYPYAYPPDYMAANFGFVKIKTDRKDASVFVDGGFADKLAKAKKYALRPGNHDIELRDSDGRTIYKERVAVIVGKTTELHAG